MTKWWQANGKAAIRRWQGDVWHGDDNATISQWQGIDKATSS
jgi:hypothetical protein